MTTMLEPPTSPSMGSPDDPPADPAAAARKAARTQGRATQATAPTRAKPRPAKSPTAATRGARGARIDPAPWAAGITTVTVGLWVLGGGLTALLAGASTPRWRSARSPGSWPPWPPSAGSSSRPAPRRWSAAPGWTG